MKRVLYTDNFSQPARAVLSMLEHIGILDTVEIVTINLTSLDQIKPEYKAVNPNMKIPAYQEGELLVFESCAILRYLCNTHLKDDNSWFPRSDPLRCALINAELVYYYRYVRSCSRYLIAVFLAPIYNAEHLYDQKLEMKKALEICGELEKRIGDKMYLLEGNHPTIADALVFQEVSQLLMIEDFELSNEMHGNLKAYLLRMKNQHSPVLLDSISERIL